MKKFLFVYLIYCFSLFIIISCSSEDDAALKDGKVAANLSEADQLEAPNISSLNINNSSAATNQTAVSVKLSGTDAVGITGYIFSNQSTAPDLSSSSWVSITSQTQYSVSKDSTVGPSDASYSFYGWMKDGAANISAKATASIYYDTTAPTLSSVSINSGDSSTSNTVVNLTISASDSLSGISAYYASETSTAPSATTTGWIDITKTNSLSTTKSYTLSSPGQVGTFTKTVYLWVKDSAGNVSDSASDSIQLILTDQSAPTNPSISINSGASSTASSSVTLSLSATDDIGVTGYYLSQTSSTPSSSASGWTSVTSATSYSDSVSYTLSGGNGTNTVYVWFKDGAGNVSSSASDSINLQDDPPSNPSISINSGASSTASSSVTLSLSATDDVGVTGYYLSQTSSTPSSSASGWISVTSATSYSDNASYTLTGGDGTNTVYVWFKDAAGNVSSTASDSITLVDLTLEPVTSWGSLGSNSGQFSNPQYTHVYNSKIYVADKGLNSLNNKKVAVYDLSGNLENELIFSKSVGNLCIYNNRLYVVVAGYVVNLDISNISDIGYTITFYNQYTVALPNSAHNCAANSTHIFILTDGSDFKVYKYKLDGAFLQHATTSANLITSWGSGGTGSGQYMGYGSIIADENYVYISSRDGSGITKFDTNGNVIEHNGTPKIRQIYFNPSDNSEIFGWDYWTGKFKIYDTSLNVLKTSADTSSSGIPGGDHGLSADSNGNIYISGYGNDYQVSKYKLTRN